MTTMKAIIETKTSEVNSNNYFDTLCQGFHGGSFYGLEYILEDFFQINTEKPSVPACHFVDWFDL
jgi:hypothetical protein